MKMKVEGLKTLEASLKALNKEYGGKSASQAMRPAVKASMAPVTASIRGSTPVDSGTLRDSTATKIGKPSKKHLQSEHYNKNTVIYGQSGWFWKGKSLWKRSLAVEYGTRSRSGLSILRSALDSHHSGMIKRFKDTLGPSIEKKAKSLAKKRSKL